MIASKKDTVKHCELDHDYDEEGLDDREPEKALCPETNAKSHYTVLDPIQTQTFHDLNFNQVLKE
jgi:hypothetical protein